MGSFASRKNRKKITFDPTPKKILQQDDSGQKQLGIFPKEEDKKAISYKIVDKTNDSTDQIGYTDTSAQPKQQTIQESSSQNRSSSYQSLATLTKLSEGEKEKFPSRLSQRETVHSQKIIDCSLFSPSNSKQFQYLFHWVIKNNQFCHHVIFEGQQKYSIDSLRKKEDETREILPKQIKLEVAKKEDLLAVQIDLLSFIKNQKKYISSQDSLSFKFVNENSLNTDSFIQYIEQFNDIQRPDFDLLQIISPHEFTDSTFASSMKSLSFNKKQVQKNSFQKHKQKYQSKSSFVTDQTLKNFEYVEDLTISPIYKQSSQQYSQNSFLDFGNYSYRNLENQDKNQNNPIKTNIITCSNSPNTQNQFIHQVTSNINIFPTEESSLKRGFCRQNSAKFSIPIRNLERIRESDEKEEDVQTRIEGSCIEQQQIETKRSTHSELLIIPHLKQIRENTLMDGDEVDEEQDVKLTQKLNNHNQDVAKEIENSQNMKIADEIHTQQKIGNIYDMSEQEELFDSQIDSDYRNDSDNKFSTAADKFINYNPELLHNNLRNSLFFEESHMQIASQKYEEQNQDSQNSEKNISLKDSLQKSFSGDNYVFYPTSIQQKLHKSHTSIPKISSFNAASPSSNNRSINNTQQYKNHDSSVVETSYVKKQINEEGLKKINNYTLLHQLGRGGFGKVKLAEQECLSEQGFITQKFAIKISNKKKLKQKLMNMKVNAFTLLEREVAIMKKIDHPNLVKLYEVIDDPEDEKIYMVMEYMQKGAIMSNTYWKSELLENNPSLYQTIFGQESITPMKKNIQDLIPKKLSPDKCRKYFQQLALAIDYMHNQAQVIHRDIKPENILISEDDNLKIADFGVSHIMDSNNDSEMKDNAGTKAYTAPEGWSRNFKGKPLDMWACGVTLYQMAIGDLPFFSKDQIKLRNLIINEEIKIPPSIDPLLSDLIKKLLSKNPDDRITAEQMLEHPWLTENGQVVLKNSEIQQFKISDQDIQKAFTKKISISTLMKVKMKLNKQLSTARNILHNQGSLEILNTLPDSHYVHSQN